MPNQWTAIKSERQMRFILLIIYVITSSIGVVLIRLGGIQTKLILKADLVSLSSNWLFMSGLLFYVISFPLWIVILQKFELTYISPIAYGLVFVSIAILSRFLLHEVISWRTIVGFILIFAGIVVFNIKR
jgi:drug/metabolite transporter (DMT)-like permease